jgi:hypothetical protein
MVDYIIIIVIVRTLGGARRSSGQCARRAVAEAKHRPQWPVLIAESLSQHDENHVVPTPLSGIRVGGRVVVRTFPIQSLY